MLIAETQPGPKGCVFLRPKIFGQRAHAHLRVRVYRLQPPRGDHQQLLQHEHGHAEERVPPRPVRPESRLHQGARRGARPLHGRREGPQFAGGRRLRHRGYGGEQHPVPRRARVEGRAHQELDPHAGRRRGRGRGDRARDPGQARHGAARGPADRAQALSHRGGQE